MHPSRALGLTRQFSMSAVASSGDTSYFNSHRKATRRRIGWLFDFADRSQLTTIPTGHPGGTESISIQREIDDGLGGRRWYFP